MLGKFSAEHFLGELACLSTQELGSNKIWGGAEVKMGLLYSINSPQANIFQCTSPEAEGSLGV